MTSKQRRATRRNFTFYVLRGMVSNLHRIYYERRKESHAVLAQIGICIEVIEELMKMLKESDRG